MCLAAFAINVSARWPLVLASNRDEFFDRPALPLSSWQTAAGNTIISGRDTQAGGTWLGMTPGGRVALLTNVREGLPSAAPRSRGELVMRWLEGVDHAHAFAGSIDGALYGGFNLVLGDMQSAEWHWWSNRPTGPANAGLQKLENGVYGLSNAALDTPWPKTVALKSAMVKALQAPSQAGLEQVLWQALSQENRAAAHDLPQTGVPHDLELALSSARVVVAERNYGTRCASLIVFSAQPESAKPPSRDWTASFKELTYPSLAAAQKAATLGARVVVCPIIFPAKTLGAAA